MGEEKIAGSGEENLGFGEENPGFGEENVGFGAREALPASPVGAWSQTRRVLPQIGADPEGFGANSEDLDPRSALEKPHPTLP